MPKYRITWEVSSVIEFDDSEDVETEALEYAEKECAGIKELLEDEDASTEDHEAITVQVGSFERIG